MKTHLADRLTGILGIVLSASYVTYARNIEDSLLADEVGAAGVPTAVGAMLMLAAATLLIKGSIAARQSEPDTAATVEDAPFDWRPQQLALALLGVLAAYGLLLSIAGYTLSIALLIAAVAWLVGAREPRTIALCAVSGGLGLYGLFTVLLQIHMPPGLWPAWMGT